jgi:heme/copper-type cytochrome/quinol oxidase subunit 3
MEVGTLGQGGGTSVLAPLPPRVRRAGVVVPHSCPPFDLPPFDADDGGGGGGGDEGRGDGREPDEGGKPAGTAELAFGLALVGIATLFAIFLLAWFLMRRNAPTWPSAPSPAPHLLWLATVLLLASSLALHAARGTPLLDRWQARRAIGTALFLGTGFLAAQGLLWRSLIGQGFVPSASGHGSIFYALTGLHALHVLAGLGMLASLFAACFRPSGPSPRRLRLGSAYWHSMGAIWVVLFAVLYLAG